MAPGKCNGWLRGAMHAAIFILASSVLLPPARAQEDVAWQPGPLQAQLGEIASIHVPDGYVFFDKKAAARMREINGDPANPSELGVILASGEDDNWSIHFDFDEVGFVPDDEKDQLDAGKLLRSIRESNDKANEYRRQHGGTPIEVVGWEAEPRYNETTNRLEWCLRGKAEEGLILNHNTRILGRRGVMSAILVVDPANYASVLPAAATLLQGFSFTTGNRYSEYKKGDRVAEIGLTALVAGGAGALAMKAGLLKKFGKLIVVAIAAIVGAVSRFVRRLFGRREADPTSPVA